MTMLNQEVTMDAPHGDVLTALLDREAIRDCIHRSALANDMLDLDMWKSTYWPDGREDHDGMFVGNAHEFVDSVGSAIRSSMDATFHQVSNSIFRFDGATAARIISYAIVYGRMVDGEGGRTDLVAGVRYLDRFEKRNGEWRILDRVTKSDWLRPFLDSLDWDAVDPSTGQGRGYGARRADDPVGRLFPDGDIASLRRGISTAAEKRDEA